MLTTLSVGSILLLILASLFVGIGKGGIAGAGSVLVPLIAILLGGKDSIGFLLPLSLVASFIAAMKFREDINWMAMLKILPWAIIGILLAVYLGNLANEHEFFILLSAVILIGCAIIVIQHYTRRSTFTASHTFWVIFFGILAGFSSMIGNAVGPLISTLFILQRFPKKQFVSTYVWFCFFTDFFKVPFHIFIWKSITADSIILNLYMTPAMLIGVFLGFWLVKVLPENAYKNVILTLSCVTALLLLVY